MTASSFVTRLPQILRDCPELKGIGRLTLWDEQAKQLISFRDLSHLSMTA